MYFVFARNLECDVCVRSNFKENPNFLLVLWWLLKSGIQSVLIHFGGEILLPRMMTSVGISYFDEATDLHVAAVVREGVTMPGNMSVGEFSNHFFQDWLKPQVVRCDVEGCFRAEEILRWFEGQAIRVEHIAGEAPWQLGKHSRHLYTLKILQTTHE